MEKYKYLALPGYAVAILMVFVNVLDAVLSVSPPRMGDVAWRFGAAGYFSRAFLAPLVGMLLIYALAVLLEHPRVQRLVAAASAFLAVTVVAAIGFFMLDALEMRSRVRSGAELSFDVATGVALGKYVVAVLVLAIFAVCAWRSSRTYAGEGRGARRAGSPLVRVSSAMAKKTTSERVAPAANL